MLGKFITFEGVDGSGKSLQMKLLADYLRSKGKEVVETREPGGTKSGLAIRKLLVEKGEDKMDEISDALLYYASRRLNIINVILPALEQGKYVLCDRFNDSTLAYQYYGYAKFPNTEKLDSLYKMVAGDLKPDCTFLFDLDAKKGLERSFKKAEGMTTKETRFESFALEFHQRIRLGFLELAQAEPERFVTLNADDTIENIHKHVLEKFYQRYGD